MRAMKSAAISATMLTSKPTTYHGTRAVTAGSILSGAAVFVAESKDRNDTLSATMPHANALSASGKSYPSGPRFAKRIQIHTGSGSAVIQ